MGHNKPFQNFLAQFVALATNCKKTEDQKVDAFKRKVSTELASMLKTLPTPPKRDDFTAWAEQCQTFYNSLKSLSTTSATALMRRVAPASAVAPTPAPAPAAVAPIKRTRQPRPPFPPHLTTPCNSTPCAPPSARLVSPKATASTTSWPRNLHLRKEGGRGRAPRRPQWRPGWTRKLFLHLVSRPRRLY
ncbi:hypothetical protein BC567DRAFT_187127 [Phyllosticta citribraziliensis]